LEKPSGRESTSDQGYRKEEREVIEHDKLPASLKKTLQEGDQYKGWESATFYLDKTSKQYLVELGTTSDKRIYRFDENGKAVRGNVSVKEKNDQ
jgi:hypothetical protein